jgi:glycine cleavage system aminomethyltransferase T
MLWGGELLLRDGEACGHVTSAAWGESVGGCVGLAYVRRTDGDVVTKDFLEAGSYQVDVAGQLVGVTVSLRPPYDPRSERVKA